jgi:hypothetical protein
MHSSVIGKVEKANRYARELDRIRFERLSVTFRGDNDSHRIRLDADGWGCTCHSFATMNDCAHVLAMQKVLGAMLAESDQQMYLPDPAMTASGAATA